MNQEGRLSFFTNLSPRERWMVGGGAAVAVSLIVYMLWVEPTLERIETLNRLLPRWEAEMTEFREKAAGYLSRSAQVASLQQRIEGQAGGSSFSFLGETAEKHNLRRHIVFIRPLPPQDYPPYRERSAEVKLDHVRLAQVAPFLSEVERFPYRLKQLSMKAHFADSAFLDVQFVVSSHEKIGDGEPAAATP